jgi:RNA polymerase primary sigma factor
MIQTINKMVRTSRQCSTRSARTDAGGAGGKTRHAAGEGAQGFEIAKEPLSLETPIGDEEDSHLGDFIEDKNAILPIDAAIQSNLRETTTGSPRSPAKARAAHALRHRHEHRPHAGGVGQQFSVTRERIRQMRRRRCGS